MTNKVQSKVTRLAERVQRGVSLVEMMIYLALCSILMVGIVQLFVANQETYNLLAGQSRMQESARFALEFIGRAIRSAGYKGCFSSNQAVTLNVDATAIPFEFDVREGIEGFDGQAGGFWLPDMTTILPATNGVTSTNVYVTRDGVGTGNGIPTEDIITQTDILATRAASVNFNRIVTDMPTSQEDIEVVAAAGGLDFVRDELALIEDCEKATLFRVTDITMDAPAAGQATIFHEMNPVDAWMNLGLQLAEVNTFERDGTVIGIDTHVFYIAPGAGVNNRGNTPLSLWRKTGLDAPVELVEGVEDLQILFGVDSDDDGVPNQYLNANLVTDFTEVTTARISVTVNSVDDVGGTTAPTHGCSVQSCVAGETYDGLIRRTFSQTIQLRNHGQGKT